MTVADSGPSAQFVCGQRYGVRVHTDHGQGGRCGAAAARLLEQPKQRASAGAGICTGPGVRAGISPGGRRRARRASVPAAAFCGRARGGTRDGRAGSRRGVPSAGGTRTGARNGRASGGRGVPAAGCAGALAGRRTSAGGRHGRFVLRASGCAAWRRAGAVRGVPFPIAARHSAGVLDTSGRSERPCGVVLAAVAVPGAGRAAVGGARAF